MICGSLQFRLMGRKAIAKEDSADLQSCNGGGYTIIKLLRLLLLPSLQLLIIKPPESESVQKVTKDNGKFLGRRMREIIKRAEKDEGCGQLLFHGYLVVMEILLTAALVVARMCTSFRCIFGLQTGWWWWLLNVGSIYRFKLVALRLKRIERVQEDAFRVMRNDIEVLKKYHERKPVNMLRRGLDRFGDSTVLRLYDAGRTLFSVVKAGSHCATAVLLWWAVVKSKHHGGVRVFLEEMPKVRDFVRDGGPSV